MITAAILAVSVACVLMQAYFDVLRYMPLPSDYSGCGKFDGPLDCASFPAYSTLSLLSRLIYSPLGAVCAATAMSVVSLAVFRFLPMVVVATLGSWYMLFEAFAPSDSRSAEFCLLFCGVLSILAGWTLDIKFKNNYGFWVNKLGVSGAAVGLLYFFKEQPELSRLIFLVFNVLGVLVALYLKRASGAFPFLLGVCSYATYEYTEHFEDSNLFPYALCAIGVGLIILGRALHQANKDLGDLLPTFLNRVRPKERDDPVFFGEDGLLDLIK